MRKKETETAGHISPLLQQLIVNVNVILHGHPLNLINVFFAIRPSLSGYLMEIYSLTFE